MSATIIPFPTKQAPALRAPGQCIDVLPVDRRGFVILDACVPLDLAVEFMALHTAYLEKPVARVRGGVPAYDRSGFSFDMNQPDPMGPVLIDACVPQQLATDFLKLAEVQSAA